MRTQLFDFWEVRVTLDVISFLLLAASGRSWRRSFIKKKTVDCVSIHIVSTRRRPHFPLSYLDSCLLVWVQKLLYHQHLLDNLLMSMWMKWSSYDLLWQVSYWMEVGRSEANTPAFHQPVVSSVLSYFRWPSAAKLDDPENDPNFNYFKTENSEDSLASTAYSLHHLRNGDFSSWSGVVGSGGGMYNKGNEGMHASLNPNHLWLIWFLSMIAFVFILFGCSLRNKYFQESFLLSRAKQWVHLPVLNSAQDPLLLVEPGSVSYTVADCCSNGTDWEPTGLNEQHADLTWVSETDKFPSKPEECSNIQIENDSCSNQNDSILHPSLVPLGSTPQPQDHGDLMAMENQIISSDYVETPVCLSPLTKTGSLDETQIGSCRKELQEKRFKANRSVEEFHQPGSNSIGADSLPATPAGKGVGGGSSSPGTPQGKSRAKLQERRGSSHSLTIAVKSTENTLPPVTTPREWY